MSSFVLLAVPLTLPWLLLLWRRRLLVGCCPSSSVFAWDVERRLWLWAGGFIGDNIKTDGDEADDDFVGVKVDFAAGIVRDDVDTAVEGSTDDGRRLSSLSRGIADVMMDLLDRSKVQHITNVSVPSHELLSPYVIYVY